MRLIFNILVIEDDLALARGIELALREEGRAFALRHTLAAGREALSEMRFDLIVLDVSLPDGSGLDFCREVRSGFFSPILFLTANDTELDIVTGLELGGDDYVTKPFSLAVLRARVNALLRRNAGAGPALQFGGLSLDFEKLHFTKNGAVIELSKTEQRLLHMLASNPGQTIPRERLQDYIWPDGGEFVDENALSVAVSRLRGKLEENPAEPRLIKTVRGIGYCWAVRL